MKHSSGFRIILAAMFASMVCVSTLCIQIPSPMGGYVNLGDVFVLMSGLLLGPVYGTGAAAIGSALADMLTGYIHYAPGTLLIKGAVALTAALLIRLIERKKNGMPKTLAFALAGIPGEILMVLGYLVYAWIFLGYGAAAISSVPGNIAQGAAGILISSLLTPLVLRPREIQEMLRAFHKSTEKNGN